MKTKICQKNTENSSLKFHWIVWTLFLIMTNWSSDVYAQNIVEIGDQSANCQQDPDCINRLHPAIPMTSRAKSGATIIFHTRNASDINLDPEAPPDARKEIPDSVQSIHLPDLYKLKALSPVMC